MTAMDRGRDVTRELAAALVEARARTLALCALVDDEAFHRQFHPDFSPVGWHLGHCAVVQAYWLLERAGGQAPMSQQVQDTFTPERNPKANRVHLPARAEIVALASEVADRVAEFLAREGHGVDPRMLWSVVQHEQQHGETVAMVLALADEAGVPVGALPVAATPAVPPESAHAAGPRWIEVPAARCLRGSDVPAAYDNERDPHAVDVGAFALARCPVTRGEYSSFIEDGGYHRPGPWSAEGWHWARGQGIRAPRGWDRCTEATEATEAPVWGLSWYEADAFARWAGARLPTEAEWERAARWDAVPGVARTYPWGEAVPDATRACFDRPRAGPLPVGALPAGASPVGALGMAGGVWEWTASWFGPYPGFTPWPYEGYSTPWFGDHRVLRGGSFASRATVLRGAFRNWYVPGCREVFAGVRLARDGRGPTW